MMHTTNERNLANNAEKNLATFFTGEPPGQRCNSIHWWQKRVMVT